MILINTIFIIWVLLALAAIYSVIKIVFAYIGQMTIHEAVHLYTRDMSKRGNFDYKVNCYDIESLDKTFFRLFDFGYKNILPEEKYEIIEPYIKKGK